MVRRLAGHDERDRMAAVELAEDDAPLDPDVPARRRWRGWALVIASAALVASATTLVVVTSDGPDSGAVLGADRPHPDGRIVFGRITRTDETLGVRTALFAVDPDGTDERRLTEGASAHPAWSPDGTRIAYATGLEDGSWQVATMAPDGTDVRVLTSGPGVHEMPSWSPDGRWLAYGHNPDPLAPGSRSTLWRMDADGGGQRPLGARDTVDLGPRVSPDGRSVLFVRVVPDADPERATLMVRDLGTGEERSVPAAGDRVESPTWSPDGRWIAYDVPRTPNRRQQLEKVRADGSGEPVVLLEGTTAVAGYQPAFSPDGTSIAFVCFGVETSVDEAICVMGSDGSDVRLLSDHTPIWETQPTWGPVAKR
ncbi:TolB family protein [Cellulomonas aerilata]|uniref:Uncharacterized protein n=1 Tax=Cellulomonas aerilata TaxID=515326 RepID=A0A512DFA4_9CELL|nr:TolB family protein [Cellulomonas aerilata]GEO35164.1 hypothetical protein CAE01nite_28890 [Cellulomonas aerilata]